MPGICVSAGRLPVSVVSVTRNARPALELTVESIRSLADQIDEFIVIDGASTDGTPAYLAAQPVVSSWISEPDSGVYDAMNKGWALAKDTNHILFLGAGDRLVSLPQRAELASSTVVYGDVECEGRGIHRSRADYRLLIFNSLHHQALLVPKALHPAPPFDTRYRVYADYEFNLRLFRRRVRFQESPTFRAYASAAGVSGRINYQEMVSISARYNGPWVGIASRIWHACHRLKSA